MKEQIQIIKHTQDQKIDVQTLLVVFIQDIDKIKAGFVEKLIQFSIIDFPWSDWPTR